MVDRAFQTLADNLTTALIGGDFALYASLMALPVWISTRDGLSYVLADEAALRADFHVYHGVIAAYGVTDIYREVRSVTRIEDSALAVCQTHVLRRAQRLFDPFATLFRLQLTGAGWRISAIESSESHIRWTLGRSGPGTQSHASDRNNPDAPS